MLPRTLGVIGLGAVGGSLAWRASRCGVQRIVGYAALPRDAVAAARVGAVTEIAHGPEDVAAAADFVVLAVSPGTTLELLDRLAGQLLGGERRYVTDVASVKGAIVERAARLGLGGRFAGSHPLVDAPDTGFRGARLELLDEALVYVTPTEEEGLAAREVADFWTRAVGAHPVTLPAERHDELLAWTSHLPRAVTGLLAATLAGGGPEGARYGGAALEATAAARGDPAVGAEALWLNRRHLLQALDGVKDGLGQLERLLRDGSRAELERWLESAAAWRERAEQ
jgi:prephenate dehydrogenase